MKKLVFLSFLFLSFFSYSQKPADKRLAGLDTFVVRVLKSWNAPGVSIAVIEKNKVVYTGGFGYRDYEKKLPVTENSLFAIGSCTKAFTAAMLGMLEKEGKLSIDKPVRDYLPELKFQNEYANNHVTLRDMMSHRTGLPRHDLSWYGSTASRKELLERIQYLKPTAELRERYQYNNFMFMAQGVAIEKLTGKSWEENLKERIFKPLGMNKSVVTTGEMEVSTDHSRAYSLKNDSLIIAIPFRNIDAIGPAGSINSSAKEMANWLITWINGGKFNNKEIIPAGYVNQAIMVQTATGGGVPGKENADIHFGGYGLGWGMSSYRGHYRVEHGGGIDGFITTTSFYPSDSIGIFVVSNQSGPSSSIRNFIADRMLKLEPRNWIDYLLATEKRARDAAKAVPNTDSLNRKKGTRPSVALADYAGTYSNPGYGSMIVSFENDQLGARLNAFDLKLEHFHFDQFRAVLREESPGFQPLKVSFHLDGKGNPEKLTVPLQFGVKDIEFKKEIKAIAVQKTELEKYAGDYEFAPGSLAKFYIKNNNTLYAFVEGQPEYELVAVKKDEFNFKTLSGYSVKFEANEKGEIAAVNFIQPNGIFKATRKK